MTWISVKDRLPEFYMEDKYDDAWHEQHKRSYCTGVLLVYAQHADMDCWGVYFADYNKIYDWRADRWYDPCFIGIGNPIRNVTHWMPLPEPPKV